MPHVHPGRVRLCRTLTLLPDGGMGEDGSFQPRHSEKAHVTASRQGAPPASAHRALENLSTRMKGGMRNEISEWRSVGRGVWLESGGLWWGEGMPGGGAGPAAAGGRDLGRPNRESGRDFQPRLSSSSPLRREGTGSLGCGGISGGGRSRGKGWRRRTRWRRRRSGRRRK